MLSFVQSMFGALLFSDEWIIFAWCVEWRLLDFFFYTIDALWNLNAGKKKMKFMTIVAWLYHAKGIKHWNWCGLNCMRCLECLNWIKWCCLIVSQGVNVIKCSLIIFFITFGSDANTCCFTSQMSRSDGNCKHLNTFNSGTWTRTKSHPSRASGGGSSSKPSPPANIGAWSIFCGCCIISVYSI